MVTFIVALSTQMGNTKMRSSKHIIKSDAQQKLTRFGFGRKCFYHNYFELS